MSWNDERVELLKKLWADGLSASQIAAELGVSTDAISEAVRIATIGDVGANLAKFDIGDRQIPIRVQLDEKARGNRAILEQLKVATGVAGQGAAVPLATVATVVKGVEERSGEGFETDHMSGDDVRAVLAAGSVPPLPTPEATAA